MRNKLCTTTKSVIIISLLMLILSACTDSSSSGSASEVQKPESTYETANSDSAEEEIEEDEGEEESDTSQDPRDSMSEEEYLAYLTETIPYVGMSEEYIDKTACGPHTETKKYGDFLGYRWSFYDLHALVVKVDEGKVIDVNPIYEQYFWDGDMPHLEEVDGKKVWRPIPGALHKRWEEHEARRDKDVDNFATAEEYADYYHDDFLDVYVNEEYYEGGIDDLVALEDSYLDAIDYWEKHQPWPEPEY